MTTRDGEIKEIKEALAPFRAHIKRPGSGSLLYDYLVPSGPYEQLWDWDCFFMGVTLATEIPSEAVYLKNWVLNFVHNSKSNGRVAGCLTKHGFDERVNQMKPFLAQGAFLASKFLSDFMWLKKRWSKLKKIVLYREKYLWSKKYDLGVWFDGMESGSDNNVAVLNFPKATVVAADLNAYLYLEYKAMHLLAKQIGRKKDEKRFAARAEKIKENIQKYLWNAEDETYYNIDGRSGEHIKRISYTSFVPLWGTIATEKQAISTCKRYLLSPEYLWSQYGIRTLAQNDLDYNNQNIMKPYSNWQGPVWIISNYIMMHGLLHYGFQKEAIEIAQKSNKLILDDIKTSGKMHENYDAETGKPLAAPDKIGWNLLVANMLLEAVHNKNPFAV